MSPELRRRIEDAIDRLGWVPDGAARAWATRRTSTTGAVFPTLTHGDFPRAAHATQAELLAENHTLLLACSEYDLDQEYRQVRKVVDGARTG